MICYLIATVQFSPMCASLMSLAQFKYLRLMKLLVAMLFRLFHIFELSIVDCRYGANFSVMIDNLQFFRIVDCRYGAERPVPNKNKLPERQIANRGSRIAKNRY